MPIHRGVRVSDMSEPSINGSDQRGLTQRDLLMEVRTNVQAMRDDLVAFKPTVVTKADFNLWNETRRQTLRWGIGIIVSIVMCSTAVVTLVLANT